MQGGEIPPNEYDPLAALALLDRSWKACKEALRREGIYDSGPHRLFLDQMRRTSYSTYWLVSSNNPLRQTIRDWSGQRDAASVARRNFELLVYLTYVDHGHDNLQAMEDDLLLEQYFEADRAYRVNPSAKVQNLLHSYRLAIVANGRIAHVFESESKWKARWNKRINSHIEKPLEQLKAKSPYYDRLLHLKNGAYKALNSDVHCSLLHLSRPLAFRHALRTGNRAHEQALIMYSSEIIHVAFITTAIAHQVALSSPMRRSVRTSERNALNSMLDFFRGLDPALEYLLEEPTFHIS